MHIFLCALRSGLEIRGKNEKELHERSFWSVFPGSEIFYLVSLSLPVIHPSEGLFPKSTVFIFILSSMTDHTANADQTPGINLAFKFWGQTEIPVTNWLRRTCIKKKKSFFFFLNRGTSTFIKYHNARFSKDINRDITGTGRSRPWKSLNWTLTKRSLILTRLLVLCDW